MKLITRDTDYALRALCAIAKKKDKIVSVTELVKALKIPRPFLRKILQALNKSGILKSYKGPGGGFKLYRSIDKILLVDVIEAYQGKLRLNECFFKKLTCPNTKTCALKKKIDRIEKSVLRQLRSISIKSLLRK